MKKCVTKLKSDISKIKKTNMNTNFRISLNVIYDIINLG